MDIFHPDKLNDLSDKCRQLSTEVPEDEAHNCLSATETFREAANVLDSGITSKIEFIHYKTVICSAYSALKIARTMHALLQKDFLMLLIMLNNTMHYYIYEQKSNTRYKIFNSFSLN